MNAALEDVLFEAAAVEDERLGFVAKDLPFYLESNCSKFEKPCLLFCSNQVNAALEDVLLEAAAVEDECLGFVAKDFPISLESSCSIFEKPLSAFLLQPGECSARRCATRGSSR